MKITRLECVLPNWIRVVNAARRTVGKKSISHEPSGEFKKKILLAEHSPIRLLEYDFTWEDIKQWVTVHLVRHHEGCEKFVHTQREDRRKLDVPRDELPQGSLNDMDMTCNAQAFINISRKRLCSCASLETRRAWENVKQYVSTFDPSLASVMVRECVYRGFCPEYGRCCGYVNSLEYKREIAWYRAPFSEEWKEFVPYDFFGMNENQIDAEHVHERHEVSNYGRIRRVVDEENKVYEYTHIHRYLSSRFDKDCIIFAHNSFDSEIYEVAKIVYIKFVDETKSWEDMKQCTIAYANENNYDNTYKNLRIA